MSYAFLKKETAPRILVEAYKLIGTKEIVGKDHNPKILQWAKDLGMEKTYTNDEIPWCGLFMAHVCRLAGVDGVVNPLWARNWNNFGTRQVQAMLGDVLVFARESGGHVGIYVGEDAKAYHVLGGNQGDAVSITRILKSRCVAVRRCAWKVSQPKEVKQYFVKASGIISTNEK